MIGSSLHKIVTGDVVIHIAGIMYANVLQVTDGMNEKTLETGII